MHKGKARESHLRWRLESLQLNSLKRRHVFRLLGQCATVGLLFVLVLLARQTFNGPVAPNPKNPPQVQNPDQEQGRFRYGPTPLDRASADSGYSKKAFATNPDSTASHGGGREQANIFVEWNSVEMDGPSEVDQEWLATMEPLKDPQLSEEDARTQLSTHLAITHRKLERDQIQLLDWLNGEFLAPKEEESNLFGGSLIDNSNFNAAEAYNRALEYTRTLPMGYNRFDYAELARRARALHILLRVSLRQTDLSLQLDAKCKATLNGMRRGMEVDLAVDKLTRSLFPWLTPTWRDIESMHASALKRDDWGIVITGGTKHFYLLQHLILSLRTVHNLDTPIEIFHAGPTDMNTTLLAHLTSLPNVTARNLLLSFPHETHNWEGWSLKPYALLAARARRVLFIDADVLFLRDPLAAVRTHPIFARTGQLFFRDRRVREERFLGGPLLLREVCRDLSRYAGGLRYTRAAEDGGAETHAMDSGVVALDKGNLGVLMSLLLAAKMNAKVERDGVLYQHTYGDKESFWFASEMLRVPYAFNEAYGGVIGRAYKGRPDLPCGISLLQVDHEMKPLFLNGGFLMDRMAPPDKAEFIPFDLLAVDPHGKASWEEGMCLKGAEDKDTRRLSTEEKEMLHTLQQLFKTKVKTIN
ncbi:mannosyltransferase putative-domain-containing protein [Chytriomyces sp. MP71]|nr:mannosyltransferase putative-domain-containing protein [Chytriomyces sp. MP71]